MDSKIKDGNFTTIQSWMVKELGLKGNELIIYAVIYMFSQDGEGKYTGSLQYLADWTNTSKRNVMRTLKSLEEKELVVKEERLLNGVKYCQYYGQNVTKVVTNCHQGMDKMSPNNKEENKDIYKVKEIYKEKYFESIELNKAFTDFVDMRKEMKPAMTDKAIELAKKKIMKMSNGNEEIAIAILEQSVMNGWKGLFGLKENRIEYKGIEEHIPQSKSSKEIDDELATIRELQNGD